ncbi:PepSY domain-containing protein [Algibacter pacificus]|uniref:PepSY domain-containing protein n=1 Tax=Algibacter pacificus TaxID=2599389 RepID=UPI0011C70101|nr:PepSY domain-containing protein [Algibacter pacificus]
MNKRKKQAKLIRVFRKIHKTAGAYLFILFFIISISGLLLGWKKNSYSVILPKTKTGVSTNLKDWLPLSTLENIAFITLKNTLNNDSEIYLKRIDARPEKGVVKFIFDNDYMEIQLDASTGKILSTGIRRSDLLEDIHDGSILDNFFQTEGEIIKLIYSTTTGGALLIFTITGFWLWYGPKKMKKNQRQ